MVQDPPVDWTPFYIALVIGMIWLVLVETLGRMALIILLYLLQHHWRMHKQGLQKWENTFYCADCCFTFEKKFHKAT